MAGIRWLMPQIAGLPLVLAIVVLVWGAPVWAAAPSGPSLRAGLGFHTSSGRGDDYDSNGFVLGGDYQLPVDSRLSLNPFVAFAFGGTDNLRQDPGIVHTQLGLEGRLWLRNFYIGPHAGFMTQAIDGDNYERDGSGLAYGLVLGLESSSGTYLEGRFVRGRDLDVWSGTDVDVRGLRLNLGYRFR